MRIIELRDIKGGLYNRRCRECGQYYDTLGALILLSNSKGKIGLCFDCMKKIKEEFEIFLKERT